MVLEVDGSGLAVARTEAAAVALGLVDADAKERAVRQGSKNSAHRTDVVAICAAMHPCQNHEHDEGHAGDDEHRQ